jgi:hypothetical protein
MCGGRGAVSVCGFEDFCETTHESIISILVW